MLGSSGGIVAGMLAMASALALASIPNTLAMWIVIRTEYPDRKDVGSLPNCFLCIICLGIISILAFLIQILWIVYLPMGGLALMFAPLASIVFYVYMAKATIEGLFEIQDGADTIYILYIIFTILIKVYIVPLFTGEANEPDPYSGGSGSIASVSSPSGGFGGGGGGFGGGSGTFVIPTPHPRQLPQAIQQAQGRQTFDPRSFVGATAGGIHGAVMLPDGKRIFSSGPDAGVAYIIDAESGSVIHRLPGHSDKIYCVDVSPDGKHGLTGSRDDTIKVWDLESGKMLRTLEGHQGDVLRVKFHPTEFRAASGGADTNVLYWDLESGEHRRFPGHTSPITALDFSPDGYLVMSAATDQTARLIDFLSQKEVAKVERLGQVTAGAFSPDRRHALIGNIAGDLMWIDFGKERIVDSFSGHFKAVLTIDIADKNGLSVTGGMGGSVYVWGEFASRDHDRLEASFRHEDNVRQVAFTSHDPSILVTSGDDGMVKVWDVLAEIEDDSFGSP